jgi:TatD DNase family protein
MLVETDSPFLAPIPHRGQPNQPAWTRLVAEKVADIKGISLEEAAAATTANFFRLFHKAKPSYFGVSRTCCGSSCKCFIPL